MLVSIDPGLNHCGFAVWSPKRKELVNAGLARNTLAHDKKQPRPEVWAGMASAVVRRIMATPEDLIESYDSASIVIEVPVVRQRGSGKGDPNDLIDIAGVVSACVLQIKASIGGHVVWAPKPEEWKGQLPKAITESRVREKLSETESGRIEKVNPGLIHNVFDSIHLGLVYLKRA